MAVGMGRDEEGLFTLKFMVLFFNFLPKVLFLSVKQRIFDVVRW